MKLSFPTSIVLCTALVACTTAPAADTTENADSSSSMSSVSSVRETNNVSYIGMVKPAGISIYSEGTHRLVLETEKIILLESSTVDLNGYVNENVEVYGSTRPTVESDAMIMDVETISLVEASQSSAVSSELSSLPSTSSSEDATSVSSEVESSTSSSSLSSETLSEASSDFSTSSAVTVLDYSEEFEARIVVMSNEDIASNRWTQQYCTTHIGFCVPVHKNWWFQSFGATSTDVWHVEMNSAPLDTLHDGPIAIRLLSGTVASAGKTDGQISVQGNTVTGYRSWTDGNHFEITGDVRLQAAIQYITNNLEVYNEE